jgi:hypothetical protein
MFPIRMLISHKIVKSEKMNQLLWADWVQQIMVVEAVQF